MRWLAAASCLALLAGPAAAIDVGARARRELVPTGSRATIELDAPSDVEDTVRELRMEKGKSVFVRTSYAVRRVSVGDPAVADVLVLHPQELQIVARDVGSTNVVVWSGSGQIEAAIELQVGRPFSDVESEIRRVIEVGDVRIDSAGESIVLTGSVPDAQSLERVVAVSRAFFPEKAEGGIVNLLSVGGNQQVMIEVTVSEMSRSMRKAIGTNFAARIVRNGDQLFEVFNSIGGLTVPPGSIPLPNPATLPGAPGFNPAVLGSQAVGVTDAINLIGTAMPIGSGVYEIFVNALDESGLGKVLAEPTLVARTGQTAHFLAGGELAYPVAQGGAFGSISVEYKDFGVGIEFTPTVLSEERIHLDVTTEVSEVDFALGTRVAGFITLGLRTRRASTGIEVGDGQTFAIAGLLRDDLTEQVSQYPLLGSIPILGMLFRSSTYQKQLTELGSCWCGRAWCSPSGPIRRRCRPTISTSRTISSSTCSGGSRVTTTASRPKPTCPRRASSAMRATVFRRCTTKTRRTRSEPRPHPRRAGGSALVALAALVVLSGAVACETPLDRAYGRSQQEYLARSIENPEAGAEDAVVPSDGMSTESALSGHRESERDVEESPPTSVISIQSGARRTCSGSSAAQGAVSRVW